MSSNRTKLSGGDAPAAPAWRRPFRNAGVLAVGRATKGLLAIAYMALAARALGVSDFGALVLLNSLVMSLAQLARFQSWQAVMKYGAEFVERADGAGFRRLLVFALRLDLAAAVVAVTVFWLAVETLAGVFGLSAALVEAARIYVLLVFFVILSSTPLGVLRLFDRHDLVAWQTVIEPVLRVLGALGCFLAGGDLLAFLTVWFLSSGAGRLATGIFALSLLRERDLVPRAADLLAAKLAMPRGTWRFVIGTHFTSSLNLGNTQLGILLAGWLLGPAGAGYFRIARQFANVLIKPTSKLLVPAIFTDMAEFSARGDHATRRDVVHRSMAVAGAAAVAVFCLLAACGQWLIATIFGAEYLVVYPAMLWLAAAGMITIALFPFEPMLIAAGHVRAVVTARAAALVVFAGGFYTLVTLHGLTGAGMATALAALVTSGLLWLFGARLLAPRRGVPADG